MRTGSVERELSLDHLGAQHRRIESGVAPRLPLLLEPCHLLRRDGHRCSPACLQVAADVEPTEQRLELQRRPPPRLKRGARTAEAHVLLELPEGDTWITGDQAKGVGGAAPSDAIRLEQHDFLARRRKGVRRRTAGQAAADDDDWAGLGAAMAWIGRHARLGIGLDPR